MGFQFTSVVLLALTSVVSALPNLTFTSFAYEPRHTKDPDVPGEIMFHLTASWMGTADELSPFCIDGILDASRYFELDLKIPMGPVDDMIPMTKSSIHCQIIGNSYLTANGFYRPVNFGGSNFTAHLKARSGSFNHPGIELQLDVGSDLRGAPGVNLPPVLYMQEGLSYSITGSTMAPSASTKCNFTGDPDGLFEFESDTCRLKVTDLKKIESARVLQMTISEYLSKTSTDVLGSSTFFFTVQAADSQCSPPELTDGVISESGPTTNMKLKPGQKVYHNINKVGFRQCDGPPFETWLDKLALPGIKFKSVSSVTSSPPLPRLSLGVEASSTPNELSYMLQWETGTQITASHNVVCLLAEGDRPKCQSYACFELNLYFAKGPTAICQTDVGCLGNTFCVKAPSTEDKIDPQASTTTTVTPTTATADTSTTSATVTSTTATADTSTTSVTVTLTTATADTSTTSAAVTSTTATADTPTTSVTVTSTTATADTPTTSVTVTPTTATADTSTTSAAVTPTIATADTPTTSATVTSTTATADTPTTSVTVTPTTATADTSTTSAAVTPTIATADTPTSIATATSTTATADTPTTSVTVTPTTATADTSTTSAAVTPTIATADTPTSIATATLTTTMIGTLTTTTMDTPMTNTASTPMIAMTVISTPRVSDTPTTTETKTTMISATIEDISPKTVMTEYKPTTAVTATPSQTGTGQLGLILHTAKTMLTPSRRPVGTLETLVENHTTTKDAVTDGSVKIVTPVPFTSTLNPRTLPAISKRPDHEANLTLDKQNQQNSAPQHLALSISLPIALAVVALIAAIIVAAVVYALKYMKQKARVDGIDDVEDDYTLTSFPPMSTEWPAIEDQDSVALTDL